MQKKIMSLATAAAGGLCMLLSATPALAANLVDAYNQALTSDPTFKQAEALWLQSKTGVQFARASLLPQIAATGKWAKAYTLEHNNQDKNSITYALTLDQPIFNYSTWQELHQASYTAQATGAIYNSAAQALISSVVTQYFAVLQAYNKLHYDVAKKNADRQQYITVKQQYNVGLKAITDVYAAQAQYDADKANIIADRNNVTNALESLGEITGVKYSSLNDIRTQVPLVKPSPASVDSWVNKTKQQNYTILSDRFTLLADKANIKSAFGGHLPTLDLTAGVSGIHGFNQQAMITTKNTKIATVGLAATMPIFSGGGVVAQTKQARYQYLADSDQLEIDSRSAISQTRQSYLSIVQGIAKIKADKEAIISSNKALMAAEAGYRVGTVTIQDVLSDITLLNQNQQIYYNDQYTYLMDIISLKQQAGILNVKDIKQINRLLTRRIVLSKHNPAPRHNDKVFKASKIPFQSHHHAAGPAKPSQHTATAATNQKSSDSSVTGQAAAGKSAAATRGHNRLNAQAKAAPQQTHSTALQPLAAGNYSLQLYASTHLYGAQNFYHAHAGVKNLHLIHVQNPAGENLYKVTYGAYPNYMLAKRALTTLPARLRVYKPWVTHINSRDRNVGPDHTPSIGPAAAGNNAQPSTTAAPNPKSSTTIPTAPSAPNPATPAPATNGADPANTTPPGPANGDTPPPAGIGN